MTTAPQLDDNTNEMPKIKLPFVPWCTQCGGHDIAEYVNGLPNFDYCEKLEKQGYKFIYNGCCVDGDEPDFHCNTCAHDYTWREWHAKRKAANTSIGQ